MVRLLIMGRAAMTWERRLREVAGPQLDLECARLPAEGIRRFEATPPDALLVVDTAAGQRARTLIQAIHNRPLGRLVPILLISPTPDSVATPAEIADELDIFAWMPLDAPAHEVVHALADALELSEDELTRAQELGDEPSMIPPPFSGADPSDFSDVSEPRRAEHGDFVMEQIPDDEEQAEAAQAGEKETPRADDAPSGGDASEPRRGRGVSYEPPAQPVSRVHRDSLFPVRAREVRVGEVSEEVLRRKLKEVRHEDYYTILEVRRGAEGAVIKEAYQRLRTRYDSERLDFDVVRRFYDEIDEIQDALEDAYAVLGDADLRERYRQATRP